MGERMTEKKRFATSGYKIYDTFHDGVHWLVNVVEAEEIVEVMNNLDLKARERSKALSKLQKENEKLKKDVDYWKQVASQYNNELNVFEHCKKYKTECKDIYWSSD